MAKKAKQESVRADDAPKLAYKVVRGSNNSTRATLSVYEYPNGDVCLQLEDKRGGGEMWTTWQNLSDDVVLIAAVCKTRMREIHNAKVAE